MIEIKPDTTPLIIQDVPITKREIKPWIFVAGSIEMGKAENWQEKLKNEMEDFEGTLYNPRRDDWDSSWEQREYNDQFNEQVNWELDRLEESDFIFMYFDPNTKSPISLLELGKFCWTGNMIVVCPDDFWRKGNVEVVCTRYNVPLYNTFEEGVGALKTRVRLFHKYN